MWQIYLTNSHYFMDKVFDTFAEAFDYGELTGFRFCVFKDGELICAYDGDKYTEPEFHKHYDEEEYQL